MYGLVIPYIRPHPPPLRLYPLHPSKPVPVWGCGGNTTLLRSRYLPCNGSDMNPDRFERVTVVLGTPEARYLRLLADALGVSRSSVVRDLIDPPLRGLGPLLDACESRDPAAARAAVESLWIDATSAYLELEHQMGRS